MTGAVLSSGNVFRIGAFPSELHAGIEPDPKLVQRFPVHVGTTVIRLERRYGAERLEAACTRAVRLKLN